MTTLLQQAIAQVTKLPSEEQDSIAQRLLAEMAAEDAFDEKIAATAGKLAGMAKKALQDYRNGLTTEFDADQI